MKQNYLSQAIFAASRPRTVMPLLFGLAVAADYQMSSKWLYNVLYKYGFAVSYDEVCKIWVSLRLGFSLKVLFQVLIRCIMDIIFLMNLKEAEI